MNVEQINEAWERAKASEGWSVTKPWEPCGVCKSPHKVTYRATDGRVRCYFDTLPLRKKR